VPRSFDGERIGFSTNGAGVTSHAKESSWTFLSHHTQILSENKP